MGDASVLDKRLGFYENPLLCQIRDYKIVSSASIQAIVQPSGSKRAVKWRSKRGA
jgi:hypothetical protein